MWGYAVSLNRESKMERAEAYVLAHPDESKQEQAAGAKVSHTMIAIVRKRLILKGKLQPSRKDPTRYPRRPRAQEPAVEASPAISKPAAMLDHQAMTAMGDMIDAVEGLDDLTDDDVHKRLLKQCLTFAFNSKLHPDTRMSASQMWAKLRDQAKSKDLGPGVPLLFEDAVERARDLMVAMGPEITLAAVNLAFTVKESDASAEAVEPGDAPSPPAAPPATPDDNAGPPAIPEGDGSGS